MSFSLSEYSCTPKSMSAMASPSPSWGSLQRSTRPPSCRRGMEGRRRKGRGRGEGKGNGGMGMEEVGDSALVVGG